MKTIAIQFLIWLLPLVLKRLAGEQKQTIRTKIFDRLLSAAPKEDEELLAAVADELDESTLLEVIQAVFEAIPQETIQVVGDALFDIAENAIEQSPSKWDDRFLLPAIALARKALDIPDHDAAEAENEPPAELGPEINL